MTLSGLPKPLPECSRCGIPMRRNRWAVTTGVCSSCTTPAEAMRAAQRAARLTAVDDPGTAGHRRTDARIERLAARRADRAAAAR